MTKGTRLNLRISDAFKEEIQQLADYHGLTMSSYAHSLLVKAIRRERESTPEAFPANHRAPVVARIEPAKAALRRKFAEEVETVGTKRVPIRGKVK